MLKQLSEDEHVLAHFPKIRLIFAWCWQKAMEQKAGAPSVAADLTDTERACFMMYPCR